MDKSPVACTESKQHSACDNRVNSYKLADSSLLPIIGNLLQEINEFSPVVAFYYITIVEMDMPKNAETLWTPAIFIEIVQPESISTIEQFRDFYFARGYLCDAFENHERSVFYL